MIRVRFQIHGSLQGYLPRRGAAALERDFEAAPAIKDAIEAIGVAHPEIDLVLANGEPVGLDYRPADGDLIDVFGIDRPPALGALPGLVPAAPAPIRFVLDGHLGRLARYLRTLGFDAAYSRDAVDAELAAVSAAEDRVLLTRDRGLLKRSIVRFGYLVRADDPRTQLLEVAARYRLRGAALPYSRCVRCNGSLARVGRADVADALKGEPRTLRFFDSFGRCADCGAVYWAGSHVERQADLLRRVLG